MDKVDDFLINFLIEASLPKNSLFGKENFAGDNYVKDFCQKIIEYAKFDLTVYVTWACLPNVSILRRENQFILLRSERFDTLSIEFFHLKKLSTSNLFSKEIKDEFIDSTILRWLSEFFIGHKDALLVVDAWNMSRMSSNIHLPVYFLRDEALASISLSEKLAIQCFTLAHEIGHILNPKRTNVDIHFIVDGLELLRHVQRDFQESKISEREQKAILEIAKEKIDYSNLLYEIEADLYALRNVVIYLHFYFSFSLEESFRQTLSAFSGLSFLNSCKKSCGLIKNSLKEGFNDFEYTEKNYLEGLEIYIRAKCVMRRAGIFWAEIENQGKKIEVEVYSNYVNKVDSLFLKDQSFYFEIANSLEINSRKLISENNSFTKENKTHRFQLIKKKIFEDSEGRFEFWKMLHAFGLHSAVNSLTFIENLYEQE